MTTDPWDDQRAIERNREPMHAPWGAFASAAAARAGAASPWVRSLDGSWAFHLAPRPAACPAGFERPAFDDGAWARIPVPGNWELHGHGEALYCNIAYPFAPDPPRAPADNPTGCYRTAFEVPAAWSGRRLVLEFGSVDSCFRCWINGAEVGWSTDSKLPASFDITALARPGINHLAVQVLRWGASAYLEKQDYWHLSGIQRSVRLIAKPAVHLRDWCVQTAFDGAFRDATVTVRAWASRPPGAAGMLDNGMLTYPAAKGWSVAMTLIGPDGREAGSASAPLAERTPMYGVAGLHQEAFSAVADIAVPAALAWTAETPHLYTLVLELRDPQGMAVDWERTRVGIREVRIVDGVVQVNGRRLVVRGVNRHEFHPRRGRAVTREDMREDIVAMKRLNFNAVRTCHYPDAEAWYDLCDELGMYVVDEANLETHGIEALTSRDPAWAGAYLERAIRMVLRDRNHPCIAFWSLGNESYWGPNHAAMANWVRAADPTRPVQYESGNPPPLVTDVMAPMYPDLAWVRRVLADPGERRPLIMCEYAYAKGNSTGNFRKFWELVHELPRFQGGFVWDWRDKALAIDDAAAPDGVRWRYGETRWEAPGVERMCLNGVVGPDLAPHPGAWEIHQQQAPVRATASAADLAAGRVQVHNRYQFLSLAHLRCCWRVHEQPQAAWGSAGGAVRGRAAPGADTTPGIAGAGAGEAGAPAVGGRSRWEEGRLLAEGACAAPGLAAGTSGPLDLPLPTSAPAAGAERFLEIRFVLAEETAWAPAGHEVCAEQFAYPRSVAAGGPRRPGDGHLEMRAAADGWTLSADGWSLQLDRAQGAIGGLAVGGRQLLVRPLVPTVMRAPTDIDLAQGEGGFAIDWTRCGLDRLAWRPDAVEAFRLDDGRAALRIAGELAAAGATARVRVEQAWTIHADGGMSADIQMAVEAPVATIPRLGLVCSLASAERELAWFGRGPHENYPDRLDSAFVGAHRARVGDLLTPYIFPQACGLRCEVRRAALTGADGGLLVEGEPWFHCSALPVRDEDLRACANLADLRRRDETELHLDGFHMGVGGDTGWTRNCHPEYRLPPGVYRFRLRLRPLAPGEGLA